MKIINNTRSIENYLNLSHNVYYTDIVVNICMAVGDTTVY